MSGGASAFQSGALDGPRGQRWTASDSKTWVSSHERPRVSKMAASSLMWIRRRDIYGAGSYRGIVRCVSNGSYSDRRKILFMQWVWVSMFKDSRTEILHQKMTDIVLRATVAYQEIYVRLSRNGVRTSRNRITEILKPHVSSRPRGCGRRYESVECFQVTHIEVEPRRGQSVC